MRRTDDRAAAATGGAAVVDTALAQLREAIDTLARVDVTTLPEDCVTRAVRDLSSVDGRFDGVQARFVRAAEAADVPRRSGATSTTDWLSETTGRSKRECARTGRMASTMDEAPELAERLATGDVGPDQADRIARGLDRGTLEPADAADLLEHATHLPPGSFDREAKRLEGRRQQRRLREQEQAAHAARSGSSWREDDDSLSTKVTVPPADGDIVEKAFGAFITPDPAETPDHLRRTPRQLRADAFVDICRVALAAGPNGDARGEPTRLVVHVGPEMLFPQADAERAGATGTTDLDTVLSAAAVNRLMCDATVQRLVIGPEGQVLDVGRATRKWPSATRTAITALDGGDRTPGSDLPPGRCEIHHIRWWSQGGETSVDNGVLLGKRGHAMIHEEGWSLQMDPVTRTCTWTSPDGTTTVTTHPRGTAARGAGAPHDIPQLREHREPVPGRDATGPAPPRRPSADPDVARPAGPTGRTDQSRPPLPGQTHGSVSRGDPPTSGGDPPEPAPLTLDL